MPTGVREDPCKWQNEIHGRGALWIGPLNTINVCTYSEHLFNAILGVENQKAVEIEIDTSVVIEKLCPSN